jgi:hypothetical protein
VRNQSKPGTGITFSPALTAAHPMNTGVRGAGSGITLTTPVSAALPAGTTLSSNWNTTYPQTRWVDVIQHDWAARADWMVKSYDDANHAPVVSTPHLGMVMPPGRRVALSGSAMDPDGDAVTFNWWQYYEADTYGGKIAIDGADTRDASFVVPADATPGDTIHAILEVKDSGTPALTRYQRVVVTVGEPVPGGVGGTVPATLSLMLGAPAAFSSFTPGVERVYEASTTANVISSAGDATLTVADPSATATGHLVNGPYSLAQPLQASAGGAFAALPAALKSWSAPTSNEQVQLQFRQPIGANEALRTGTYSKTLTFTLSTTTP